MKIGTITYLLLFGILQVERHKQACCNRSTRAGVQELKSIYCDSRISHRNLRLHSATSGDMPKDGGSP